MDLSPQDRRKHDIKITAAGIALLGDQAKKRLSRVRQVLEQLTDEERTQLIQLLKRTVEIWQSTEGSSTDGH
jgi:DNA-binding TFAR19-related protein (PDSD5 family)